MEMLLVLARTHWELNLVQVSSEKGVQAGIAGNIPFPIPLEMLSASAVP